MAPPLASGGAAVKDPVMAPDATDAAAAPLAGVCVALAETRELDRLAGILEEGGARTFRCPLVAILDAPDPAPVDAWLGELCNAGFDDLILLTGEGLRRLLARARVIGVYDQALAAIGRTRRITRGPKPARALHEVGLRSDLPAPTPTSQGVMEALAGEDLTGHRVGLQLYGSEPNQPLMHFLAGAGAVARPVAPYVYAQAADADRVAELIGALSDGRIDVIAFTSASQVDRLWDVAQERGFEPALRAGLKRVKVAGIGPVVRECLEDRGVRIDIVPEEPFIMKRLSAAIAAAMKR
jgi:uroporphyrinogen-III synthase